MYKSFLRQMGHALYNGGSTKTISDTDHPPCPSCGTTMLFHGDDMNPPVGDEWWECPSCGYTFNKDDVGPFAEPNDEW